MTRKNLLVIAAVALLLTAVYMLYGGHQTPPGQPTLLSLNAGNFQALKDSFNSAPRSVRIIALLSPT